MPNSLGFSVYLTQFDLQKEWLIRYQNQRYQIFTSLHIPEEYSASYQKEIGNMLFWLKKHGFYIIADVSLRTLEYLKIANLRELVERYPIDNIRIDDGFTFADLLELPSSIDLTLNASTQVKSIADWVRFREENHHTLYAMHNYYPKINTGLDDDDLFKVNQLYLAKNIGTIGFIAGDTGKRGPLYQGLPTIESIRYQMPIIAYRRLLELDIKSVFIGDGMVSDLQMKMIESFLMHKRILIPCHLNQDYEFLYHQLFKIRIDSPKNILRITDLRNLINVKKMNTVNRHKGCITLDNEFYGRYAGEIQLLGEELSSDERVNVIGTIPKTYWDLFKLENRGYDINMILPE